MKEIHISSGIIIDSYKRILLIKRGIHVKSNSGYWAVPSGKNEQGESPDAAAIREVKEEVGLDFSVEKLYLQDRISSKNDTDIKIGYRYLGKATGNISLQEEECDGYGWFTFTESKQLLLNSNMMNLLQKLYDDEYIA